MACPTRPAAWAGSQIGEWEGNQQSNDVASDIVDLSLRSRVLSLYTAFLALEPNDTIKFCASCIDESKVASGVKEASLDAKTDSSISAYPNPFNGRTVIKGRIPVAALSGTITLKIYNILGQLVKTFEPENVTTRGGYSLTWDGRSDRGTAVTSGMYIFVATTERSRQALKLLVIK